MQCASETHRELAILIPDSRVPQFRVIKMESSLSLFGAHEECFKGKPFLDLRD